jgi:hypothetical protein
MEELDTRVLNPWVSIWIKPRATMQQIVETNPERLVLFITALAGIDQVLNRASTRDLGDRMEWPYIFLIALIFGPIGSLLSLYLGGALIHWTGRWLGGQGTPQTIRAALAWSRVPLVWRSLLWIPELALFRQELFTAETPNIDANPMSALLLMGLGVMEMAIGVWAFIVLLKCLGQVQGFSAWKALANVLLPTLLLLVLIALVAVGIAVYMAVKTVAIG